MAILRRLQFLIAETGTRIHQGAGEAVADLGPALVQHHPHRNTGAIHPLMQRTQIARQPVRQHRHHPVGEIGRIAAPPRLAVQRRTGGDVRSDIGDGDPNDMAARIGGISIRLGKHRVVAVAGVGGVYCHQSQPAQVLAFAQRLWRGAVSLGDHRIGESVGDAMLMNGDQADRFGGRRVAQPVDDPRHGQAQPVGLADLFALDQFAVPRAVHTIGGHNPFLVSLFVDRHDPTTLSLNPEDADHLDRVAADLANEPRFIMVIGGGNRGNPCQYPVALGHRRIAFARHEQHTRLRPVALPFQRFGKLIAIAVGCQHQKHRHRRQRPAVAVMLVILFQRPVALQLFQPAFQVDPCIALDAERLGDVTLGRQVRMFGNPGQNLFFGRDGFHGAAVARTRGKVRRNNRAAPGYRWLSADGYARPRHIHRPDAWCGRPGQTPPPGNGL